MIEAGLFDLIIADPTCQALIGGHIAALNIPDAQVFPCVTFRVISTVEDYTLDGATGFTQMRLQVDSWADTYPQARQVAAALRNVLNAYSGTLSNGCDVLNITRDGEQTGFDEYARKPYVQTDWLVLYSD